MIRELILFLACALTVQSACYSGTNSRWNITNVCFRRHNEWQNQWEIDMLVIRRHARTSNPKFGASFWLYRSYSKDCLKDWDLAENLLFTNEPCGHFVTDEALLCQDGVLPNKEMTQWEWTSSTNTSNYWSTCQSYPHGVEGEREFSKEKQRWLKWRVTDLEEKDPLTIPQPEPDYPAEIPFISAKIEIVNGVLIQNSTKNDPRVRVFSAAFVLGKSGADYTCVNEGLGGINYECEFGFARGDKPTFQREHPQWLCERGLGPCSQLMNVTETVESLSEFNKRFS